MQTQELLLVSAGIGLRGGGAAHLARVLARASAEYATAHRLAFSVAALDGSDAPLDGIPLRTYDGRKAALAAAVARTQLAGAARTAIVFDHLGPARIQPFLPHSLRAPYALFLLGTEAWKELRTDRRRALCGARLRVAISDYTRRRILEKTPEAEPIEVLHLAIEEPRRNGPPDAALLARCGDGFVLTVGRLASGDRYKGHDELLAATARLGEQGIPARLVIAGEGDDRPRLERRAAELGLAERVLFTGHVSDSTRAELYRRARVFAMPSRGEGFGLVYLEAMRAGLPCVALRESAAAEIVVDGQTGSLVPTGDRDALATALARLLEDSTLASRWGAAGRERREREFGWERFRDRYFDVLDRLTATDVQP